MMRLAFRLIATLMLSAIVVVGVAWGPLALWFDGPQSRVLAGAMAGGLVLISILLTAFVRPFLRGLVATLLPVVAAALWWTSIPPSNTRDWTPDVARTARASSDGSRVTIENVRNFKYRSESDYDQRWETRTYNLDRRHRFPNEAEIAGAVGMSSDELQIKAREPIHHEHPNQELNSQR